MRIRLAVACAVLPLAAVSGKVLPAAAQETPPPAVCKDKLCGLILDWASEGTPTFVDRRYSRSAVEQHVIAGLTTAGYLQHNPAADAFRIPVRTSPPPCATASRYDPDASPHHQRADGRLPQRDPAAGLPATCASATAAATTCNGHRALQPVRRRRSTSPISRDKTASAPREVLTPATPARANDVVRRRHQGPVIGAIVLHP
jgi:hypothetical protein